MTFRFQESHAVIPSALIHFATANLQRDSHWLFQDLEAGASITRLQKNDRTTFGLLKSHAESESLTVEF